MRVISKETFMPCERDVAGVTHVPMAAILTYTTPAGPDLLMRIYWSIGNDSWDEHFDLASVDGGQTFSAPRLVRRSEPLETGGRMSYGEAAGLYHPDHDRLVFITNYGFEPQWDTNSADFAHRAHIVVTSPSDPGGGEPIITDFGHPGGFYVSFCHPIIDSRRRMIFPAQRPICDTPEWGLRKRGFAVRAGTENVMADYEEPLVLIGEFTPSGTVDWHLSRPLSFDVDLTSRGMCEPTIVELHDGRFAMICRGSNARRESTDWAIRPGYKWLSYSDDGCETWSRPEPLACSDGTLIESSSTGSRLFRSITDGKLYWIGNLCIHGIAADGNHPRTPLVICEIQEDPIAIKRETITVIDQSAPHETEWVQHSNFRCYQDRQAGDVVLFMNRFFERGGWENLGWHDTDLYRYRISLGEE